MIKTVMVILILTVTLFSKNVSLFATTVNFAKNDTLSVREKPNYHSKKLGALPLNATIGVDRCKSIGKSKWCRVYELTQMIYSGKSGWVNAKYLKFSNRGYVVIDGKPNCDYTLSCKGSRCKIIKDIKSDNSGNIVSLKSYSVDRSRLKAESRFGAGNSGEGYCAIGSMVEDYLNKHHATTTPKPLSLNCVNSRVFKKFAFSNNLEHQFVHDTIYPLAYSSTKFAYIIEHDNDPADFYSANFVIVDLVRDRVLYIDKFKKNDPNMSYRFKNYWHSKKALIKRKLRAFNVNKKDITFKANRLYVNGNRYRCKASNKEVYNSNFNTKFITASKIYLQSKNDSKMIDKKWYKSPSYILAREPIGFLKLGNNKRAVILVGKVTRGWEGPPHNIGYEVVGAKLSNYPSKILETMALASSIRD